MKNWLALTTALNRTMVDHAPGWTNPNASDPGSTLLAIMAYLTEGLLALDAEGRIVVRVNDERWQRVRTLADAEAGAPVFMLDEATGVLTFGDGVHGRRPERGSAISIHYRDRHDANLSVVVRATWPWPHRTWRIVLRDNGTIQLEDSVVGQDRWSGTKRPRFFPGRIVTADDLAEDQAYHVRKYRLHLQSLHGAGVVQGLQVDSDGDTITIQPGLAIDGLGREIHLDSSVTVAVGSHPASSAWIVVEYIERAVDPVSVPADACPEPARIEEGCGILVTSQAPSGGVPVARLLREGDGWRVDAAFLPARAR